MVAKNNFNYYAKKKFITSNDSVFKIKIMFVINPKKTHPCNLYVVRIIIVRKE